MKDRTPRILICQFFKDAQIKIQDLDCGLNYVCVITESKDLFSWGSNQYKQLGYILPQGKKTSFYDEFGKMPRKIEYFSDNRIKIQ